MTGQFDDPWRLGRTIGFVPPERWRGGRSALGSFRIVIMMMIDLVVILVRGPAPVNPLAFHVRSFAPPVGAILIGLGGFIVARAWYACRWSRAIVLTTIFFAVLGLAGLVSESSVGR